MGNNNYKNNYKLNISGFISYIDFIIGSPLKKNLIFSRKNNFLWIIILIAIISRIYFINDPIRIDEAGTFLQFVKGNPLRVFYYSNVNNHIFFTLLVKISTIFTGTSPAALRLVAFFSGLTSIVFVYILCKSFNQNGLYAAIGMATTPYLIFYSTYARSYSLTLVICLSICLLAKDFLKSKYRICIFSVAIFSSIGLFTIPTMILPISGIYFWIFINLLLNGYGVKNAIIKFLLPLSISSLIMTSFLYLPTIILSGGIGAITNTEYTQPIGLAATFERIPIHLISTFSELTTQIPIFILIINGFFMIFGFISYFKNKSFEQLLLTPSLLFGGFMVLILRTVIAMERSWIFLIPFFLIIADEGFTYLTKNLSKKISKNLMILMLFCALIFSRNINEFRLIDNVAHSKTFPEAPFVIEYLQEEISENPENYNINIYKTLEPNLLFYAWYKSFPIKVNGISFIRTNSPFEWIRQAKIDFLKFQNKIPKRKEISSQDSLDPKQIFVEKKGWLNSKFTNDETIKQILQYQGITIYKK